MRQNNLSLSTELNEWLLFFCCSVANDTCGFCVCLVVCFIQGLVASHIFFSLLPTKNVDFSLVIWPQMMFAIYLIIVVFIYFIHNLEHTFMAKLENTSALRFLLYLRMIPVILCYSNLFSIHFHAIQIIWVQQILKMIKLEVYPSGLFLYVSLYRLKNIVPIIVNLHLKYTNECLKNWEP